MARREQYVRLTVDHSAGARWVWIWAPDIDRVDEYTKPGSSGARAVVHTRLDKLYVQETPEMVLQLLYAEPQPAAQQTAMRAESTAYAEGYQAGLKDAKVPGRLSFWFEGTLYSSAEKLEAAIDAALKRARKQGKAEANRCGDKVFATPEALVDDWLGERGQKAVPKSSKLREDITGREVYLAWQLGTSYMPDWAGLSAASRSRWAEVARWLRRGGGASAIPTPAGSEADRLASAAREAFYEGEPGAGAWEHVSERSKATWRKVARAVLEERP